MKHIGCAIPKCTCRCTWSMTSQSLIHPYCAYVTMDIRIGMVPEVQWTFRNSAAVYLIIGLMFLDQIPKIPPIPLHCKPFPAPSLTNHFLVRIIPYRPYTCRNDRVFYSLFGAFSIPVFLVLFFSHTAEYELFVLYLLVFIIYHQGDIDDGANITSITSVTFHHSLAIS